MADQKISQLTSASLPLDGTEVLPIVKSGATVKVANNYLRPKQIQSNATSGVLQIAGPAAAATRVMTVPDANFTAARTDAAQTFSGNQTFSGDVTTNKIVYNNSGSTISGAELYKSFNNGTAGAAITIGTVTFDNAYAAAIISVEFAGVGNAGQVCYVNAKRYVMMNGGTPYLATLGTDSLLQATIAFTYAATNALVITVTDTIGGSAGPSGAAKIVVTGGFSTTSGIVSIA